MLYMGSYDYSRLISFRLRGSRWHMSTILYNYHYHQIKNKKYINGMQTWKTWRRQETSNIIFRGRIRMSPYYFFLFFIIIVIKCNSNPFKASFPFVLLKIYGYRFSFSWFAFLLDDLWYMCILNRWPVNSTNIGPTLRKAFPCARPTNGISIEFEILPKSWVL